MSCNSNDSCGAQCKLTFVHQGKPADRQAEHELATEAVDMQHVAKMRHEGDPLADACMEALAERDVPVLRLIHAGHVHSKDARSMGWKAMADSIDDANLKRSDPWAGKTLADVVIDLAPTDARIAALVEAMEKPQGSLPSTKEVATARALFQRNWYPIGQSLAFRSLMISYTMPRGLKVLSSFGSNLNCPDDIARLLHTSFFVHKVMQFRPVEWLWRRESDQFRAILHVRMIHAAVRRMLRTREGGWDEATYGTPICQEDMLGTLFAFSGLSLQGVGTMGVWVRQEEAAAFHSLWRLVGQQLGIDPENIPESIDDARLLGHVIAEQSFDPADSASIAFAQTTFKQIKNVSKLSASLHLATLRAFLGEEVCDTVGFEHPSTLGVVAFKCICAMNFITNEAQRRAPAVFWISHRLKAKMYAFATSRAHQIIKQARSGQKAAASENGPVMATAG